MNLSIRYRAAWLGPLALVLTLPAVAQEPVPEGEFAEQITVRVLNLEAVVTDRDGQRVPGLDASQFTLLVGGEEVPIEYFNEVRGGEVISSADNVPELTLGQPAGVSFLLYFDEFFAIKRDRDRVLKAVAERVPNMRPEDQAAVVAWDGKALTMLSGWTSSKSELSQAIDDALSRPVYGLLRQQERKRYDIYSPLDSMFTPTGAMARRGARWNLGTQERQYAELLVSQLNSQVGAASAAMRALDVPGGRMIMLLLSGGWPWDVAAHVAGSRNRMVTEARIPNGAALYGPLGTTANLLGYTLYTVDLPGMQTGAGVDASRRGARLSTSSDEFYLEGNLHDSLQYLAGQTGGLAMLNGQRISALDEVGADVRSYYWLGLTPQWQGSDEIHDIQVEVADPSLRVRTRQSYTDLSKRSQAAMAVQSSLLFGAGATSDAIQTELGESQKAGRRTIEVPLTVKISMGALQPVRASDGQWVSRIDLFLAALDDSGGRSEITPVPLTFTSKSKPRANDWAVHQTTLKMRNKTKEIAIAIYDRHADSTIYKTVAVDR